MKTVTKQQKSVISLFAFFLALSISLPVQAQIIPAESETPPARVDDSLQTKMPRPKTGQLKGLKKPADHQLSSAISGGNSGTQKAKEYFYYYPPKGKINLDITNEKILVKFKSGVSRSKQKTVFAKQKGIAPVEEDMFFDPLGAYILDLDNSRSAMDAEALVKTFRGNPDVEYASPFVTGKSGKLQAPINRILVGLKHPSDFDFLKRQAKFYKLNIERQNQFDPTLYHLELTKESPGDALDLANLLYETGVFKFAEPDFLTLDLISTNDPLFGSQWSLDNTGGNSTPPGTVDADMDVIEAWATTTGSSNIKVAILDTGVDLAHPDLVGNLLPGYDATGNGTGGGAIGTSSGNAHGTACAGQVAAVGNNGIGVVGVAYSCKIIPVRIFHNLSTTTAWLGNGINWAWQNGADVLSNSWGGGSPSAAVDDAISAAVTSGRGGLGSPVLFSSGNDNFSVSHPASNPLTIAVGAMSMCDERKNPASCDGESFWGSNWGSNLDVAAPGVKIQTTDISGPNGFSNGDYTPTFNGTSSACPNAAGVMALILSVNPGLTQDNARLILEASCDKTGGYDYLSNIPGQPNGTWSAELGYGRVNAANAVALASNPTDLDMDGFTTSQGDCDDNNPAVYPGATEICDGLDNDCDGIVDNNNVCCTGGNILYVKADATGNNTGVSWTDAFTDLQSALNSTCPNVTEIWVATGTYKPTPTQDPFISFSMKNGLAIYGGFPGTPGQEGNFGVRDWTTNVTILSGDLLDNDGPNFSNFEDNSATIIRNTDLDNTAILDGFTISGGGYNILTGGMYNSNSSPTISNNTFINNWSRSGGGMYIKGGHPIITNCVFDRNAGSFGGAIQITDGGATITGCSFTGNRTRAGGGIHFQDFSQTVFELNVTNCYFEGNTALSSDGKVGSGGALLMFGGNSLIDISNCKFYNNKALGTISGSFDNQGGGHISLYGPAKLTNCSFAKGVAANVGGSIYLNNQATIEATNIISTDNTAGGSPNFFIGTNATGTLTNCLLDTDCPTPLNCNASVLNATSPYIDADNGNLMLSPCSDAIDAGTSTGAPTLDIIGQSRVGIVDIGAYEYQGGPGSADADMDGYTICQGDCDDNDPAINPGATEVCDGIDNNCDGIIDENNICCTGGIKVYVNAAATGLNDGSSWADAFTDLQSALGTDCVSEIWVAAGVYRPTSDGDRTVSFVLKNGVAIYGGFPNSGDPDMGDRDWLTHQTILSGDLSQNDGQKPIATNAQTNTNFFDNSYTVINGSGTDATAILDGFFVTAGYADGYSEVQIDRYLGGGLFLNAGTPTISHCDFSGNIAAEGGGIYATNSAAVNMTGSRITGNMAVTQYGGIFIAASASCNLTDCTFTNNSGDNGGGLANLSQSTSSLTNCVFTRNSATNAGGGLINYGSNLTVSGCSFNDNTGTNGAGIYINNSSPTLTNCTFNNNVASNWGGGVLLENGANPTVSNCSFQGNQAIFGGGFFNRASCTLTDCSFIGNFFNGEGGGAALCNYQSAQATITNTVFFDNSLPMGNGAAVLNQEASPTYVNCTFAGNTALSAAVMVNYYSGINPTLTNCIVFGNSTVNDESIVNKESSTCTLNHTLLQEADCPAGSTCGAGMIYGQDPLFISTTDRHLQECSPALDAGDDGANTTTTDLDGNNRKHDAFAGGSVIDMGAYEFQSSGITPITYYVDNDGDGYGTGAGQVFCTPPSTDWATQDGDCDDTNDTVYPGATETCDGEDNNCDGNTDEGNTCCPAGIVYVNDDASGLNNGSSWTDAYTDLQSALASTCPGVTEIWVAAGTYKPGTARGDAFVMKNGIAIYGGFAGNEAPGYDLNLRDFANNESTLSGEIGAAGIADNSLHIIFNDNNGLNSSALLDGFTITKGNANDPNFSKGQSGGGMQNTSSSPAISNCIFIENIGAVAGGGMANENADPTITNCAFNGNYTLSFGGGGGGIYNDNSSPTIKNCSFTNNSSGFSQGGGMHNKNGSSPQITNCLFLTNAGLVYGGGMYNDGASPTLTNCSFSGNTANNNGRGLTNHNSSVATVNNCIFWGNNGSEIENSNSTLNINNSIVQGGCPANTTCTSVVNIDPLFVSTTDLRLQSCSPALDAGDDSANTTTTDLDGNDRKFHAFAGGSMIDMGAYEFQSAGSTESEVTVSVSPASVTEDGAGNLVYTFTRTCATNAVTINFGVAGTATFGFSAEYLASGPGTFGPTSGTVTMAIGVYSAQVVVDPNSDNTVELDETVILTLAPGAGYIIGTSNAATGTITNDDAASVSIAANVSQPEANGPQVFSVTLSNPVDVPVSVNFSTADGSATTADNDYTGIAAQTVTFAAGTTTAQTVNVTVNDDSTIEPDEDFNVSIGSQSANGRNVSLGTSTRTGTIENDDMASVTLSGGTAKNEGNSGTTAYVFTATLSDAVASGFTLPFTTDDGSATLADNDYQDNDGTLTFAGTANEMHTITVLVNGDSKVELDENFTVSIGTPSSPDVMSVSTPQTATITNDDAASVSIAANINQPESNSTQAFSVTLSSPVDVPVSVSFGTTDGTATIADNDYAGITSQTVTFAAGTTTAQTVNVTVNDDNKVETDEAFNASIGSLSANGRDVTLGTSSRTGTIQNDDSATLTLTGGSSANEGNSGTSALTFTATLSNPVQGGFTVAFSTNDGTATLADNDYQNGIGTLTFTGTANEMETFTVNVNGDAKVELDENFTAQLGTPSANDVTVSGSPQTSTITNDDAASVSIAANVSQPEANGPQVFSVTLSSPVDVPVSVNFSTADGSATTADNDYTGIAAQTVMFAAGTTTAQTVDVTVNDDSTIEPDEDFNVSIGSLSANGRNVSLGTSTRTGTIENDDMASVTLSGGTAKNEGNSGTTAYVFTATLSDAVASGFTLPFTTDDGSATLADNDYQDNDGTLTFAGTANEMHTITVLVNGDSKVELDENFTVSIGTPSNSNVMSVSTPQTGTITNDDAASVSIAADASQLEANSPQVFSVTLSNPVDVPVSVSFGTADGSATTADNDYAGITSQTVTFAAGTTTAQTVNVTVNDDSKVETDEAFNASIGSLSANGRDVTLGTSSRTGTIQNDDSATLTLSGGSSANEGNSGTNGRTFTATLSNPVQGGFTVAYTTNDGSATTADNDYLDNGGTLTFAGTANEMQTFTVNVNGDNQVELDENFTVSLGTPSVANVNPSGSPQTATILNDEVDFGDAPDSYSTLLASNGPRHNASPALHLGNTSDGEDTGQPSANANGDGADEDGVILPANIISATPASVTVNASATGKLDAWVDYNGDGDFTDEFEKIFHNVSVSAGNNSLSFTPPAAIAQGSSMARFRLSSVGGLSYDGPANDGEVEDYQVDLVATQFSISDPVVTEGNSGMTNLAFVISRSVNASACSVDYAITGGSATTGNADYQPLMAGTASFTAGGATSQTINVVVNGDVTVELDETVKMTLSNPVAGSILDGSGTGTILNDDAAAITIGSPSITEGNSGTTILTFDISMDKPSDAPVSFNFATINGTATTADNDYATTNGSHTFAPGETSKTVDVSVNGDCAIEPDENFTVRLGGLANGGRAISFSGNGSTLDGNGSILNDNALPVISCSGNLSQSTDPDLCSASVTLPVPTTGSICNGSTLEFRTRTLAPTGQWGSWIPSTNNVQVFAKGQHEIEWRATDGSGSSSCGFELEILDNQAPTALCQAATIYLNQDGQATLTTADVDAGSSDNCSFVLSLDKSDFSCVNVGPNTVTLTATDGSNSHSCQASVTVVDALPPTPVCKNATVYLDQNGHASLTVGQISNGSFDNCDIASLDVSPNSFACADIGANNATLTVTDVNGNPSNCAATVTVVDELSPTVICHDISIQLDGTGNADITPAQVFDAGNSSDNCGDIDLVSVAPSHFDCNHIGPNTVTLTADDGYGNPATCNATVTVEEFIVGFSAETTPEQCGMGNGTITLSAGSGGGQLSYSIDNGATWQYTGFFEFLTTGTYTILVQANGTSGCAIDPVTVTVGQVGNPQTWFQDQDGDGYSNGNTLTQCNQPSGYFLPQNLTATTGDCNDYDANQYPGQTWYQDMDGDGYGSGNWYIGCGPVPGHYTANQLVATSGDCDDGEEDIHPNAPEICNGLDDDCDGQVDEGASGLTYVGNVLFTNQAQVDAWPQCYSVIDGNLSIKNAGVVNLDSLHNLRRVTGDLFIKSTSLNHLHGLDSLQSVGDDLTLQSNYTLDSLAGFNWLDTVGGDLKVYFNGDLTDCCPIHGLINNEAPRWCPGDIIIFRNETGCDSENEVNNYCTGGSNFAINGNGTGVGFISSEMDLNTLISMEIFPNPSTYEVNVKLSGLGEGGGSLHIFDQLGREVERKYLADGMHAFSIDSPETKFTDGNYYVRLISGEEVLTKLLVIQR